MAHLHSVYDSDTHFEINPNTRVVTNTTAKTKLVQYDHNSERFTFEVPRFIENHDMTLCDKVEIHYINVASNSQDKSADVYLADDLQASLADDSVAIFSWLISANATKYAGTLNFLIRFVCLDGETIEYAWNTAIFDGITVADGMDNGEAVIAEYSDVLEAWKEEVLHGADGAVTEIEAAHAQAMNDIAEAKETMLSEIELAAEIVQTTGKSETAVMSQKASTKEMGKLSEGIADLQERSKNLLDCNNVEIIHKNVIISSKIATVKTSTKVLNVSIPIEVENVEAITVYAGARTNRLSVVAADVDLQTLNNNDTLDLHTYGAYDGDLSNAEGKIITVTPCATNKFLWVYFYNSDYDTLPPEEILSSIMVQYGSEFTGFQPYYVPKNTARIEDIEEQVTDIKSNNRWNTRNKIYGIQFNTEDITGACSRLADAVGKSAEANDFDSIYPWCDMRLCNVKLENGKKTITYDGEAEFTRDGSNGNVMVEIPAFYVCRERIGTTERWLISGEKKGGFELHPWFKNADGSTVEFRYYGAYIANIDKAAEGVFSYSGEKPFQYADGGGEMSTPPEFIALLSPHGYSRNTIYAVSALQYLFCIEYATINSQAIMNGVTYCPYFSSTATYLMAKNIGETTNTFKLSNFVSKFGNAFSLLGAGMLVGVGTPSDKLSNLRTITEITADADNIYVTVDGNPIAITEGLGCYPIPQRNGFCDNLDKHTGCATGMDEKVAPFRYRYIENIWGNLWEMLDGVRIINGVYYLSDKEHYGDTGTDNWDALGYTAPMVSAMDTDFTNRITRLGVDNENKIIALPDRLYPDVPSDMTYETIKTQRFGGDAFYSREAGSTIRCAPLFGGGWDHHENAGLFCMRFLYDTSSKGWLYGERITC